MKKSSALESDDFERLLHWLAPERESAGKKYEEIRHSLIQIMRWNHVSDAEDVADQTINIVASKLPMIANQYAGEPALYFFGVAKNLLKQQRDLERKRSLDLVEFSPIEDSQEDRSVVLLECLDACLDRLSAEDRDLLLGYYTAEKRVKIDHRKALAERLGVTTNSLRVRVFRLRATLETCIGECLEKKDETTLF